MIETILEILGAGLSIWDSKEKTKFQDRYLRLIKEYREENDKHENYRSQLALDRIERELRDLGRSFAYSVRGENAPTEPR